MEQLLAWSQVHLQLAIASLVFTLGLSLGLTRLVIFIAQRNGLLAKPRPERWHCQPTALFGGVAIFASASLGWAVFLPPSRGIYALVIGAIFLFLSGFYDDVKELRPAHKVIPQFIVASVFTALFYQQIAPQYVWVIPFAIFWIVGITNAINLLDNMDGLAGGVSLICSLLMAAHAAWMGDTTVAFGALILASAAGGFLFFNFNPARVFMGDCGSMFLGFSLACLSLMGKSGLLSGNLFTALLLPTLVLATPVFDTFFVAVVRFINGRPISLGGRDHTSHRLVLLGLTERVAVMWLYAITVWFGVIALWGSITQNWMGTVVLTVFSWVALLVLGIFLAEVETYSEAEFQAYRGVREARKGKVVLSRVIRYKRRVVEAVLDFAAICGCWIASFVLRHDGDLGPFATDMSTAMPYVVACQLGAFYASGLYRNTWRYVTIYDLGSIFRAVAIGSLVLWPVLEFLAPVKHVSGYLLLLNALLLLLVVSGIRLAFKALRFHFSLKGRDGMRRVLVFGASDVGELAVREMLGNKDLLLQPVGFVDDDPSKMSMSIHGVKVLGNSRNLLELVHSHRIDEVVIAMSAANHDKGREVERLCRGEGVECREVRGIML